MKALAILLIASTTCLAAPVPHGTHTKIPLQEKANSPLDKTLGRVDGNDLKALTVGEQTFNKVPFEIGKKLLQTRSKFLSKLPAKIEGVEINLTVSKLHILQATTFGNATPENDIHCPDGREIGEYVVHYADKTTAKIPIIYGKQVRDWCSENVKLDDGQVAWEGENDFMKDRGGKVKLFQTIWTNPHPDKKIATIDLVSFHDKSPCGPFCVALTAEGP